MNYNRRNPEKELLRSGVLDLQAIGVAFAHQTLAGAIVSLDIDHMVGGFSVPRAVADGLEDVGLPRPTLIDGINLKLAFDRKEQTYHINNGAVGFDNGTGIVISSPTSQLRDRQLGHMVGLFGIDAAGKAKVSQVGTNTNGQVHDFFDDCGIPLPSAPQMAPWSVIVPSIAAAEKYSLISETSVPLTAAREVIITEHIISSQVPASDTDIADSRKKLVMGTGYIQEITLKVADETATNKTSLEAVFRSQRPLDKPTFRGLYTTAANIETSFNRSAAPELIAPTLGLVSFMLRVIEDAKH